MKKRIANWVCAGVQIAALLVFLLGKYATYSKIPGTVIVADDLNALFAETAGSIGFSQLLAIGSIWPVIGAAFLLLGIAMSVISALRKDSRRDGKSHTVVSFAALACIVWSVMLLGFAMARAESFCNIAANTSIITVLIVFLAAAVVCNMVKRSNLIIPKE